MDNVTPREKRRQEDSPTAKAWSAMSRRLAEWAIRHLVNRRDAWGSYLPIDHRTSTRSVRTAKGTLTREILVDHFRGADVGDLIGLYTTAVDNTCRWVLIDIDHHADKDADIHKVNRRGAIKLFDRVTSLGLRPILTSSNGQGGYHLLVPFSEPIPAAKAFEFGNWLVRDWRELGLVARPEAFPKQAKIGGKVKYGNWVRLPGRHHTRDWHSMVWVNGTWAAGADAVNAILAVRGSTPTLIPTEAFSPGGTDDRRKVRHDERDQVRSKSKLVLRTGTSSAMSPVELVLDRLTNVRPCGEGWSAKCPNHNDHDNSLTINEGNDGRALIHCHAGCKFRDIVEELELAMRDMFAKRGRRRHRLKYPRKEGT